MTHYSTSSLVCDFPGCEYESEVYYEEGQAYDNVSAAIGHRSMAEVDGRRWWCDAVNDIDLCYRHKPDQKASYPWNQVPDVQ